MLHLLSEAGRAFLKAFGASLLVLLPGVLAAPDLTGAYALGVSAIIAALVGGLGAIQVFVPQLSFKSLFPAQYAFVALWVDTFARAFIGSLVTLSVAFLSTPDISVTRAAITGIIVGAVTAGLHALQGLLTPGQQPVPQKGLRVPTEY